MRRRRYPQNKWKQACLLANDRLIANHFPATTPLTERTLGLHLRRYPVNYVKPRGGGQGRNIIRVDRLARGAYRVRKQGGADITLNNRTAAGKHLGRLTAGRSHVIQQGIRSVTRSGRPFDIRVHVQNVRGQWVVGGMVGKVARADQIVTNRHRGATPTPMEHLLRNHLGYGPAKSRQVRLQLQRLSLRSAVLMRRGYPGWRSFGIDFGLDEKGTPWIYEINIYPGIKVFRALSGKTAYRRILANRWKNRRR